MCMEHVVYHFLFFFVLRPHAAIPLSIDHKPDRSDERQRIEQAGGFIIWAGKQCLTCLTMSTVLFVCGL